MKRRFAAYFWFVGWDCFSFGVHISFSMPNVEVHVPFGFVRVGWIHVSDYPWDYRDNEIKHRALGWHP